MDQSATQFDHDAPSSYEATAAALGQDYPRQEWGELQPLYENVIPATPFVPDDAPVRLFASDLHSLPLDPQQSILSHEFPPTVYDQEESLGYWDANACATSVDFLASGIDPFNLPWTPNSRTAWIVPSSSPHSPAFQSLYLPQSHTVLGPKSSTFSATWELFPEVVICPPTFRATWGPLPDFTHDPQTSTFPIAQEPSPDVAGVGLNPPPPALPLQESSGTENTAPRDADERHSTEVWKYIDLEGGKSRCVCVWQYKTGKACGFTSRIDLVKRHIWAVHFKLK